MSDTYDELRAALEWDGKANPGLKAARKYATWYLGDPNWADNILHAYLNPERTLARLQSEQER